MVSLVFVPIAFACWLKYKYRQINFLFILLFAVGITQGLCENIAFFALGEPGLSWGLFKGAVIAVALVGTIINPETFKRPLSRSFLVWSAIYGFLLIALIGHVFEAINNGQTINSINVFQNFGAINMLMVYIVFFNYNEKLVDVVIEMISRTGMVVSVIAIFQWIAFRYYEIDTRLLMAAKDFGSIYSDDGEALRVFSVFSTHYGLSAFLTLVTILHFSRWLFNRQSVSAWPLLLFVVAHTLTFNLTGIFLTASGCGFALLLLLRRKTFRLSVSRLATLILASGFVVIIIMFNETFSTRLAGVVDYSATSSGAGYSLYERMIFLRNAFGLLLANPFGIGLSLTDVSLSDYNDLGYVRIGLPDVAISADAYFVWLILQIGIALGIGMLLLYCVPLGRGIALAKATDANLGFHGAAFSSIIFVILLGALSNSSVLTYPPSNILFWCAVGALFAMRSVHSSKESIPMIT
jgi:hypothetical protein